MAFLHTDRQIDSNSTSCFAEMPQKLVREESPYVFLVILDLKDLLAGELSAQMWKSLSLGQVPCLMRSPRHLIEGGLALFQWARGYQDICALSLSLSAPRNLFH